MIKFLAAAAKNFREAADPKVKIIRIAVTADLDPSTIWRFEQGHWPRDPDRVLSAYGEELEIEPLAIWAKAHQLANEEPSTEADEAIEVARDAAGSSPGDPRYGETHGATEKKQAAG